MIQTRIFPFAMLAAELAHATISLIQYARRNWLDKGGMEQRTSLMGGGLHLLLPSFRVSEPPSSRRFNSNLSRPFVIIVPSPISFAFPFGVGSVPSSRASQRLLQVLASVTTCTATRLSEIINPPSASLLFSLCAVRDSAARSAKAVSVSSRNQDCIALGTCTMGEHRKPIPFGVTQRASYDLAPLLSVAPILSGLGA